MPRRPGGQALYSKAPTTSHGLTITLKSMAPFSINKYLLNFYYYPGPMAGTGSTVENRVKIVLIIQSF